MNKITGVAPTTLGDYINEIQNSIDNMCRIGITERVTAADKERIDSLEISEDGYTET